MRKEEFEGLWALVQSVRAGDPKSCDPKIKRAWWLMLEPYPAEAAKNAILTVCRRSAFFPFIGEITSLLPSVEVPVVKDASQPGGGSWIAHFTRRWDAMMEAKGYPSLEEWLEAGKPSSEWWGLRGKCQLEDPEWMALFTEEQRDKLKEEVS